MITQINFSLQRQSTFQSATLAYPLYAWLLSHIPEEDGDLLHEQGAHPISQFVWYDNVTKCEHWTINLLNDDMADLFLPILEQADKAELHQQTVLLQNMQVEQIPSAQALIQRSRELPESNRFAMQFLSPTSFKQNNRYVIFPQETLILQSLVKRWNACFPEITLDDSDAFQAILWGLHITDYKLQTLRHPLKQTRIPSFVGRIVLEAHLPAPLMEIVRALYCFAPYVGLGIKTGLGMGGVKTENSIISR